MINENEPQLSFDSKKEKQFDVSELGEFDMGYFQELEGEDGWIAIGQENCFNQQYFTAKGEGGDNLGIVGVFDTKDDKNLTHIVVDPKFRGHGLSGKLKILLMDKLDLSFITLTIDLENTSSLKSAEKLSGVHRVSDAKFEERTNKAKFIYEK